MFFQKKLYSLLIFGFVGLTWLASFFNEKAQKWLVGRRNWRKKLDFSPLQNQKVCWIHCSSLGEFEQGRPILEAFKNQFPTWKIVLTFFSPSGFEIRKSYPLADLVCYLPADTSQNAHDFLEKTQPAVAIFIKYEFWANHLFELRRRGVPTILASGIFRKSQPFFHPLGRFWREMLGCFTHFFLQNDESAQLLKRIGFENSTVAGDTRIDRVLQIAAAAQPISEIEIFADGQPIFIVGSSWPEDEKIIAQFLQLLENQSFKLLFAPHELSESHLQNLEAALPDSTVRYSVFKENCKSGFAANLKNASPKILILDNIGMLAAVYRYGRVAFIGGGFGAGIHNILEPAAFGLPVIFGPRFQKFEEARQLVAAGGAFSIGSAAELLAIFQQLADPIFYEKSANQTRLFLEKNKGATNEIIDFLLKNQF